MSSERRSFIELIAEAVLAMDVEGTAALCESYACLGAEAGHIIDDGLRRGLYRAGRLFEKGRYFIPELLLCCDAFYAGLEVLKPYLPQKPSKSRMRIVIGVVEHDVHDIGKNLVKTMLECAGHEVIDLGRDVPAQTFVRKAVEVEANVIALSTLMTSTMSGMKEVVDLLCREGARHRFKVIVGGSPVTESYAREIGADGYAPDAMGAVREVSRLAKRRTPV